ncbi:putative Glutathione S-transferase [Vibrio nigripulchritudo SFn27]|uniref:glutathione transferase n=2 Tax=Vibrio nigripulchritudo TaxID=28173 RepID=U4K4V4_9VIBR|nr:glutathione S-transferase [Vibrio nigripulchritudo]CCN68812.1 putative Glutathione S-transferase [Vibrio nigripulchritudo SFn118]CCN85297.1 putative Glutathione S-transferase [Vibrio nigripulchritudo BLFn1]CCN87553.1 putative Glutathione S-transferase [Vibrio nigripulchritudo SFn27]CCN92434.1 putative Glutathione S-transferase [Vibrio nigripulchritudo ENn2]CCO39298.1 putative Glutathione S-transferase [Vibrio nigripulchritudo SFn135]
MKLYETAMTPSSRRVTIFMKELGIEMEKEQLNVRAGDNLTPEYLAKSLNGKVPLLELDGGEVISESVAICRYLDAVTENNKALFGKDALEQANVEMWHRVMEFEGLYAGFQAFRNLTGIYSDRETCVEAWGVESKKRVESFLPKLEKRLAESEYVAADHFTIVDITGAIFIGFAANGLEIEVFESYPAIKKWFDSVSARESFQQ